MSWLFPLYLAGAGAVIAPILLHLRKKPPQDRVEISSLMFLDASPRQPVKKRRLDHWLLLLLRCFVLILLALMFARPWFQDPAGEALSGGNAVVVLVDKSASMHREKLWEAAVKEALASVEGLSTDDRCAVALFDHGLLPVWSFADDDAADARARRLSVIESRLNESEPGWQRTDLGAALTGAADWLSSPTVSDTGARKIVLVSDLQDGADVDALRSYAWPEGVVVELKQVAVSDPTNLSLAHARRSTEADETSTSPGTSSPGLFRFRLESARDSEPREFSLRWTDGSLAAEGHLPSGVSRMLSIPPPPGDAPALSATLIGDAHDFDNIVFLPPPQPNAVKVLLLGSNEDTDVTASPLFYLKRALQPTDRMQPEIHTLSDGAASRQLGSTDVVFLTSEVKDSQDLKALKAWVSKGGLLIGVADDVTVSALRHLLENPSLKISDATSAEYRMMGNIDDAHPLMSPFSDARLRDFTKVRFWKHRRIEGSDRLRTLAFFDNGDPAIVSTAVGDGAVVLFTSGWHPVDSQLALSTKFVPLIFGMLAGYGHALDFKDEITVGEAITLHANDPTRVTTPSGENVDLAVGDSMMAEEPGFFRLQSVGGGRRILAANLAPEESRTAPMDPSEISQLGVVFESAGESRLPADVEATLAASEREARQRLWWFLLLALLTILGAETWIANQTPVSTGKPAQA